MTVKQAEAILVPTGIQIAFQHRFAFNTGTILRLDNYAMINIFDDGRYYIQGEDIQALVALFAESQKPWDPESWTGEMPSQAPPPIFPIR